MTMSHASSLVMLNLLLAEATELLLPVVSFPPGTLTYHSWALPLCDKLGDAGITQLRVTGAGNLQEKGIHPLFAPWQWLDDDGNSGAFVAGHVPGVTANTVMGCEIVIPQIMKAMDKSYIAADALFSGKWALKLNVRRELVTLKRYDVDQASLSWRIAP